MRYISTRGEALPLGFIDVTLAGLARDGGLYVPQSWPFFAPDRIAALAGRPYPEAVCEVLTPYVAGALDPAELAGMANACIRAASDPAYSDAAHADEIAGRFMQRWEAVQRMADEWYTAQG